MSGAYGLKLDPHDITKLVGDPPLNDLLDGTYKCSSLVKDKGKKAENINGDFLNSVRKAFSVLQLSRPVQSQNFADIENFSDKKISTCVSNSISCDKGESCATDLSSSHKVCFNREFRTLVSQTLDDTFRSIFFIGQLTKTRYFDLSLERLSESYLLI